MARMVVQILSRIIASEGTLVITLLKDIHHHSCEYLGGQAC